MSDAEPQDWLAIIGRATAVAALQLSGLNDQSLATRGAFLERLGFSRREAANLLGTTPASLTELMRLARNQKAKGRPK